MRLIFYIFLFLSVSVSGQDFDFYLLASQQQSQPAGNPNPEIYTFVNVLSRTNEGNALTELSDETAGNLTTFNNVANTISIGGGLYMLNMVAGASQGRLADLFFDLTADTNYVIETTVELVSGTGFFNQWDGFTFYTDDTFTTTQGGYMDLVAGEQKYVRYARANTSSTAWRYRVYVNASSEVNVSDLSIKEAIIQN